MLAIAVNCDGARDGGNSHEVKYRGFVGRSRLWQTIAGFWHGGCNSAYLI
jgi:hypothetical protein